MTGESGEPQKFDPNQRFVHITNVRPDGFIEFDFSIGEPEIYVELVLPWQAFEAFCAHNQVKHLTAEEAANVEYDRLKWRYGKPGVTS
ncbi:phenol hydroxylase subunit [Thiolapillus brandeum]|nr:phenol hydroxylase subunit [Thiolapillus brandeum]